MPTPFAASSSNRAGRILFIPMGYVPGLIYDLTDSQKPARHRIIRLASNSMVKYHPHGELTMTRQAWILASASPRRREILSGLGLRFRIDPSGAPEPARKPGETAPAYAVRAARLKAAEVAARYRGGWIIGADTIVVLDDDLLGKPASRAEARAMLGRLSGRWHEVVTGICLLNSRTGKSGSSHALSRVHFRRLAPCDIERYLRTGEHADKAGAYGIQGHAGLFIDRLEGCYFNVVGFPVACFERLCRRLGIILISSRDGIRQEV